MLKRKNSKTIKKKSVIAFDPVNIQVADPKTFTPRESIAPLPLSYFDEINSIHVAPPSVNFFLRGSFKKSYAYHWLHYIINSIIENEINNLETDTKNLIQKYGPMVKNEVVWLTYEMKNLICTIKRNNRLEILTSSSEDVYIWNKLITSLSRRRKKIYHVYFLYAQTYVYRKLYTFVESKTLLHDYDIYLNSKLRLENLTMKQCFILAEHFKNWENNFASFKNLLELTMWSNCYDSIVMLHNKIDYSMDDILLLSKRHILVNQTKHLWSSLSQYSTKRIDIMCSNVGVDIFSNFLLADYLLEFKYAAKVVFNMRYTPMHVTFVMVSDAERMLKNLTQDSRILFKKLGKKWTAYFADNKFEYGKPNHYWSSPFEYYRMRDLNQELYDYLSESGLIIFIGDFHFRKLIGDFMWDSVENFITCLRGFQPTDILSLRIIRSDVLCGLRPGLSKRLAYYDFYWEYSKNYGTILFEKTLNCKCNKLENPENYISDIDQRC